MSDDHPSPRRPNRRSNRHHLNDVLNRPAPTLSAAYLLDLFSVTTGREYLLPIPTGNNASSSHFPCPLPAGPICGRDRSGHHLGRSLGRPRPCWVSDHLSCGNWVRDPGRERCFGRARIHSEWAAVECETFPNVLLRNLTHVLAHVYVHVHMSEYDSTAGKLNTSVRPFCVFLPKS